MNKYSSKLQISSTDEYEIMSAFIESEVDVICHGDNERKFFLKVAIYEIFNNSYQYGKFPITLSFKSLKDKLLIRIKDCGEGFPVEEKLKLIEEKGTQQLLEDVVNDLSGRGILMVFEMVDQVFFNKKGNDVILVFHDDIEKQEQCGSDDTADYIIL